MNSIQLERKGGRGGGGGGERGGGGGGMVWDEGVEVAEVKP